MGALLFHNNYEKACFSLWNKVIKENYVKIRMNCLLYYSNSHYCAWNMEWYFYYTILFLLWTFMRNINFMQVFKDTFYDIMICYTTFYYFSCELWRKEVHNVNYHGIIKYKFISKFSHAFFIILRAFTVISLNCRETIRCSKLVRELRGFYGTFNETIITSKWISFRVLVDDLAM